MMKVNYLDTESGTILQDELRDWSQAALNQLDKAYGYKAFRVGQLEAVNTILNGRDLIAVMPTGRAKASATSFPPCEPAISRSSCPRCARSCATRCRHCRRGEWPPR